MPEPDTDEYEELKKDPDLAFLKTITAQFQTLLGVSLIEVLSRHSTDEIYLGQRDTAEWTTDDEPLAAFERFGKKLVEIEKRIMERNSDGRLKNRAGPVKMPYMLMYPNTSDYSREGGLTGKGLGHFSPLVDAVLRIRMLPKGVPLPPSGPSTRISDPPPSPFEMLPKRVHIPPSGPSTCTSNPPPSPFEMLPEGMSIPPSDLTDILRIHLHHFCNGIYSSGAPLQEINQIRLRAWYV
ncbi:hypothetical protein V6N11_029625 [Hibiscus sabdariffa]|uniref:Lipoxygenase domain-containing protein n=1 Tax=Hibiscus sabdariffa TaxID=183260 RepID=A0ABR2P788_9ROSI